MSYKRLLALGAIVTVLTVGVAAQGIKPGPAKQVDTFSGVMELTTGYVRRSDGTYRPVEGIKVPYIAQRIKASPKPGTGVVRGGPHVAGEAYKNDLDGTYFYSGDPMPSALDDCVMASSGQGQPWTHMTVGYHAGSTSRILLRWIVFDSFVSGRGAGLSAFDSPRADWGGYFTFPSIGDWKITFDFTQVGCVVNDGIFWLASQIREPVASGEGAFREDFYPMFSGGGVAIGSSDDSFYYDTGPPDGIYDEMEFDHFGGPPGLANLLLTIQTGGTVSEVVPISFLTETGTHTGGSFFDLWFVDATWVTHMESTSAESVWPISVIVNGLAPTTLVTSVKFNLDSRVNYAGARSRVQLFNYVQMQWVTFYEGPASSIQVAQSWTVGTDPREYVSGTRQLRAKVSFSLTAADVVDPFQSWLDRTTWIIGRA